MSSMSPDMYVGEHKKNKAAIRKAENVLDGKSEDGTEKYIAHYIPDELSCLDKLIADIDSRIADTKRDIKGLKNKDEKTEYNRELEKLKDKRECLDKQRKRLQQPKWTPPIVD